MCWEANSDVFEENRIKTKEWSWELHVTYSADHFWSRFYIRFLKNSPFSMLDPWAQVSRLSKPFADDDISCGAEVWQTARNHSRRFKQCGTQFIVGSPGFMKDGYTLWISLNDNEISARCLQRFWWWAEYKTTNKSQYGSNHRLLDIFTTTTLLKELQRSTNCWRTEHLRKDYWHSTFCTNTPQFRFRRIANRHSLWAFSLQCVIVVS